MNKRIIIFQASFTEHFVDDDCDDDDDDVCYSYSKTKLRDYLE